MIRNTRSLDTTFMTLWQKGIGRAFTASIEELLDLVILHREISQTLASTSIALPATQNLCRAMARLGERLPRAADTLEERPWLEWVRWWHGGRSGTAPDLASLPRRKEWQAVKEQCEMLVQARSPLRLTARTPSRDTPQTLLNRMYCASVIERASATELPVLARQLKQDGERYLFRQELQARPSDHRKNHMAAHIRYKVYRFGRLARRCQWIGFHDAHRLYIAEQQQWQLLEQEVGS